MKYVAIKHYKNFFVCSQFKKTWLQLLFSSLFSIVLITIDIYGGQKEETPGGGGWYQWFFKSKFRLRCLIVFTWFLGAVVEVHNAWSYKGGNGNCTLNWHSKTVRYASGVNECLFLIVFPLLIMTICNVKLIRKMIQAKNYYKNKSEMFQTSNNGLKYQAIKKFLISCSIRIVAIMLVYIITWVPNQFIWYSYLFEFTSQGANIFRSWYGHITQFLPFFNAALNPILYGWSWFEFRNLAVNRFYRLCCRQKE